MYLRTRAAWHRLFSQLRQHARLVHASPGKVTVFALVAGAFILSASSLVFQVRVPQVRADDVSTSVTVLNTPPVWTIEAQESTESSTSTPTNAGATLSWTATGTDSNNDNYWLLICKTSGAPTPNSGAAPTCNGGIGNQWAVSPSTASGAVATAATTTIATFPFNAESNEWYAFICDGNVSLSQCNLTVKQGSGNTVSPFVINHPPVFSLISNDSPENPGGSVTWTATASDADTIRGGDTVRLIVCKANDFSSVTGYCGAGGTWATSTPAASNPATSTSIIIPSQDKTYNAYVFVYDQNLSMATSSNQGFNSSFVVSNVAPSVDGSLMSLTGATSSSDMVLLTPAGTSGPFHVQFTVYDNNSCQNASSGNEVSLATTSIYRSGVGQASCQVSGSYDTNSCYPSSNTQTLITCSQDVGSCSGPSDTSSTWTCNYYYWFNADPTDAGSFFAAQNWLASVQVTDDNGLLSPISETVSGNDLFSFLAFDVTQSAVAYGGLQPGQSNDPLATTTNLRATGNVGLDEDLYGDTMCTNWTAPDSCDAGGINPASEIPVANQKFATSAVAYAAATVLTSSTTPAELQIHVPKTVATSSIQSRDTYWGIQIPIAITLAGNYSGQNTITAKKSNSSFWY